MMTCDSVLFCLGARACVALRTYYSSWYNTYCSDEKPYICKRNCEYCRKLSTQKILKKRLFILSLPNYRRVKDLISYSDILICLFLVKSSKDPKDKFTGSKYYVLFNSRRSFEVLYVIQKFMC